MSNIKIEKASKMSMTGKADREASQNGYVWVQKTERLNELVA